MKKLITMAMAMMVIMTNASAEHKCNFIESKDAYNLTKEEIQEGYYDMVKLVETMNKTNEATSYISTCPVDYDEFADDIEFLTEYWEEMCENNGQDMVCNWTLLYGGEDDSETPLAAITVFGNFTKNEQYIGLATFGWEIA